MKKYIAPNVRFVKLDTEEDVMLVVSGGETQATENYMMSNRRKGASDVIWGFDDEADADY